MTLSKMTAIDKVIPKEALEYFPEILVFVMFFQ